MWVGAALCAATGEAATSRRTAALPQVQVRPRACIVDSMSVKFARAPTAMPGPALQSALPAATTGSPDIL
jgi:hypothetical protein